MYLLIIYFYYLFTYFQAVLLFNPHLFPNSVYYFLSMQMDSLGPVRQLSVWIKHFPCKHDGVKEQKWPPESCPLSTHVHHDMHTSTQYLYTVIISVKQLTYVYSEQMKTMTRTDYATEENFKLP